MPKVNPIQIQKYLGGMTYPATKDDLIRHAEQRGADEHVRKALQRLPADSFNSPNDVSQAAGKLS